MQMSGISDDAAFATAQEILIPMGEYFQIQDDYLDCYADPEVLGKIGTDILDNKCSWVVNTALQHASTAQRKVLDENYGRKDAQKEAKCKEIFLELDIAGKYALYESGFYKKINERIDRVSDEKSRAVYRSFLAKIYKRAK